MIQHDYMKLNKTPSKFVVQYLKSYCLIWKAECNIGLV